LTKFSAGDVRITTRVNTADIWRGTVLDGHDAACDVWQGSRRARGTPLGSGASAGVHEAIAAVEIVAPAADFGSTSIRSCGLPFRIRSQCLGRVLSRITGARLPDTDRRDEVTYNSMS